MGKRVGVEEFVARLVAWRGGQIWFTERLRAGTERGFAQQTFKLARAAQGVHVQGRSGHDLSLIESAIIHIEVSDRALSVTERLGPGVERVSVFQLLALRDEPKTSIGDATHLQFDDGYSLAPVGAATVACFPTDFIRASANLGREGRRLLKVVRAARGKPVVLWAGAMLREQLALW